MDHPVPAEQRSPEHLAQAMASGVSAAMYGGGGVLRQEISNANI